MPAMLPKYFFIVLFATGTLYFPLAVGQCPSESELANQFNIVSEKLLLFGDDGQACSKEHDDDDSHVDKRDSFQNGNSSCETVYDICRAIIIDLDLTTEDCLSNHDHDNTTISTVTSAQAYGYGFLMILFVSLCSLGGICLVPLIKTNSATGKRIYEHVYSLMVAIAVSALVSDAVLHLIPHAFGLHAHEEHDDEGHDDEESNNDFIWKGCVVLLGLYGFYLLEFCLHTCGHDHFGSHSKDGEHCDGNHGHCPTDDVHFTSDIPSSDNHNDNDKHNTNMELLSNNSQSNNSANDHDRHNHHDRDHHDGRSSICIHPRRVKPVAWLIIIGDGVHNIADGIALGAAISQNLSLGVSTMFALVFHELPHEFGDFVILVKSGFHWTIALFINFLQSLGAILGFFLGVAISANSVESSNWILSLTAGLFFYIALTDLLPELVHGGGHGQSKVPRLKGRSCNFDWIIRFALVNIGFVTAFCVLLVLALYEEDLNNLI